MGESEKEEKIISLPLLSRQFRNVYITPSSVRKTQIIQEEPEIRPEIKQVKEKIFSKELEDLVQKVSQKKKEQSVLDSTPVRVFEKEEEAYFSALHNVFSGADAGKNLALYCAESFERIGIRAFLWSTYVTDGGFYKPIFGRGISDVTAENFYLHKRDRFWEEDTEKVKYVEFSQSVIENPHFRKKISTTDRNTFSGVLICPFANPVSKLIVFCREADPVLENFDRLSPSIYDILNTVSPALNGISSKEDNSEDQDNFNLFECLQNFAERHIYSGTADHLHIVKITAANYLSVKMRSDLAVRLFQRLHSAADRTDLAARSAKNEFIYISLSDPSAKIYSILSEFQDSGLQFLLERRHFPDEGNNFCLYF